MLTQLRFQNFKSWKDTGEIRMAPLTGLFGTNSSGKTAILQFLLMLKQTSESSDKKRVLFLGDADSYTSLGTIFDISHKNRVKDSINFSIHWKLNKELEPAFFEIPISALFLDHGTPATKNFSVVSSDLIPYDRGYKFNASVSSANEKIEISNFTYQMCSSKSSEAADFSCSAMYDSATMQGSDLHLVASLGNNFRWENYYDSRVFPTTKFYGFPSVYVSQNLWLDSVLSGFPTLLENLFRSFYYLGPLREYPRRIYSWSGEQPQDVGTRGEYAAACMLSALNDGKRVDENVAFWLKELGLIDDFKLQKIAENRREYELVVRLSPESIYVPITDVGFGISQVLPVLTLCFYVPEGSTILFEQPEIHLHPAVQANLADVFVDVIRNRGLQIIVESHSEHLLRRLQRRIAEEQLDSASAALYFCDMGDDGASTLLPLELDTYGSINNWPKGFFGDEMGELVAMSKAALRRQMEETEAS